MAIIQIPAGLSVARQTWGQRRNDIEFRSSFGAQAREVAAPVWFSTIEATPKRVTQWQTLMMQLRGRTNQLAMWNMERPAPAGTMRGSMVLSAAAQGATALTITATGQAAKTLLAGDFIGVGSGLTQQVLMVMADATADASGVIGVTVEPPLRNAFAGGATVTWDKPKALFRRNDSEASWERTPGVTRGLMLDLIEDWRA